MTVEESRFDVVFTSGENSGKRLPHVASDGAESQSRPPGCGTGVVVWARGGTACVVVMN
jgi:hypothetical protein